MRTTPRRARVPAVRRGSGWWRCGLALLVDFVDVGLRQIHLAAQVREIRGDLLVEGDLGLQVLVARELALVEPREQGREHGLEFL